MHPVNQGFLPSRPNLWRQLPAIYHAPLHAGLPEDTPHFVPFLALSIGHFDHPCPANPGHHPPTSLPQSSSGNGFPFVSGKNSSAINPIEYTKHIVSPA